MEHIQAMLKEMQSILVLCDEPEWAEQMSRLVAKFAAVSAQDAQAVAREALRLYGGMGSLSDLVLYHQGQLSPDHNNRFASLRRDLNKALSDVVTAGSTSVDKVVQSVADPDQNQANVLLTRANTFHQEGKFPEAIQAYERAMDLFPGYRTFKLVVGDMLWELQRYEEAVQAYQDMLDMSPDHEQAWAGLGNCMLALGKHKKAAQALDRAVELDPHDARSLFHGAMVHTLLQNERKAKAYLERALALQPDWVSDARQDSLLNRYL